MSLLIRKVLVKWNLSNEDLYSLNIFYLFDMKNFIANMDVHTCKKVLKGPFFSDDIAFVLTTFILRQYL